MQIIDLHFFRVSYWNFISFLWWYHGIILAWFFVSHIVLHWCLCIWRSKRPIFLDCFQKVKTFCQFSRLMGLSLELKSYWAGLSYEAVSGCTVSSAVGGLVTRHPGRHGFCLILGQRILLPVLCFVGWHWNKGLLQCPKMSPQMVGLTLLPGIRMSVDIARSLGMFLADHWMGPSVVGPALDCGWKPQDCFRFHSQAWGLQTWIWRQRWACLPPGGWAGWTALDCNSRD